MEGYAPKGVLTYSLEKLIGKYTAKNFNMRFPEKGNFLHYEPEHIIAGELWQWEDCAHEMFTGSWNDYITSVMECAGSWEHRHDVELDYVIPEVTKMTAGCLNIDRDVLFAAFRRLYNVVLKPETRLTTHHFWTLGHALWRPKGVLYRRGMDWTEFVIDFNRKYKAELKRLDAFDQLLQDHNRAKR